MEYNNVRFLPVTATHALTGIIMNSHDNAQSCVCPNLEMVSIFREAKVQMTSLASILGFNYLITLISAYNRNYILYIPANLQRIITVHHFLL